MDSLNIYKRYLPHVIYSASTLLIIIYFNSILGVGYTPTSDGWVLLYKFKTIDQDSLNYLLSSARGINALPYLFANFFQGHEFFILKIILLFSYYLTSFGIYLILTIFFPKEILFCITCGILIFCFPTEGPNFWMGAYGINLGYLFCVFSIYFLLKSLTNPKRIYLILSLFFIFLAARSYPGYFPLSITTIALYIISTKTKHSRWITYIFLYGISMLLGLSKLLNDIVSSEGRVGKVIDLSFPSAIEGTVHAFNFLYFETIKNIFSQVYLLENNAFLCISLIAIMFWIVIQLDTSQFKSIHQILTPLKFPYFILIPSLIFISGYFPYAFSDIRYGVQRQLLFAQIGTVLFFVSLMLFIFNLLVRKLKNIIKTTFNLLLALLLAFATYSSITIKADFAKQYAVASEYQRIFLGDVAAIMQNPGDIKLLIIWLTDKKLLYNSKVTMLLNRPQFPVRFLYGFESFHTVVKSSRGISSYQNLFQNDNFTLKGGKTHGRKSKTFKTQDIRIIKYSIATGFSTLTEEEKMKYFKGVAPQVFIPPPSTSHDYTETQLWFIQERNRLLKIHFPQREI